MVEGNPAITTWNVENHVNSGINYLLTGAGFLPSTVARRQSLFFFKFSPSRGSLRKGIVGQPSRKAFSFVAVNGRPPQKWHELLPP